MAQASAIEWTEVTWNPVHGCSKVSPGCAHCYAEALSLRYRQTTRPWTPQHASENVTLKPHKLREPLSKAKPWNEPRLVFVNSMSDLFHELVPDEFIADVFVTMILAERHTFQVLTKRPERMADLLNGGIFPLELASAFERRGLEPPFAWDFDVPVPTNVWLGTSIENWRFTDRADSLRATPAAVRFISAEPLLGPLVPERSRRTWPTDHPDAYMEDHDHGAHRDGPCFGCEREARNRRLGVGLDLESIDWLIVGGESGPGHRPMREAWVRDLRDYALEAGTAFFLKQWGGARPGGNALLDGSEWRQMPRALGGRTRIGDAR